jgi:hypothetical protein
MARCRYPAARALLDQCSNDGPETNLETGGTPVHEMDGPLGLDAGHSSLYVFGNNITAVQKAASHWDINHDTSVLNKTHLNKERTVFALLGITFHLES